MILATSVSKLKAANAHPYGTVIGAAQWCVRTANLLRHGADAKNGNGVIRREHDAKCAPHMHRTLNERKVCGNNRPHDCDPESIDFRHRKITRHFVSTDTTILTNIRLLHIESFSRAAPAMYLTSHHIHPDLTPGLPLERLMNTIAWRLVLRISHLNLHHLSESDSNHCLLLSMPSK